MEKTNKFLSKPVITPLTVMLFLLISITGIQMLFHFQNHFAKGLHEFAGLGFVIFGLLHLAINWKVFLTYIKKPVTIILMIVVLCIMPFLFSGGGMGHGNPMMKLVGNIENAPLATVVPLYKMDEKKAIELLGAKGIKVTDGQQTIADIAKSNRRNFMEILDSFSQNNG